MKIVIKTMNGTNKMIELDDDANVGDLKQKWDEKFIEIEANRLIFWGKSIRFEILSTTLSSLGIKNFSSIFVVSRPTGGGWANYNLIQSKSVKSFTKRFEEYKPESEDENNNIRFYKAQSIHKSILESPFIVKYEIDENLEEDWIQSIKKGLRTISMHAPGIKFIPYSNDSKEISNSDETSRDYRIKFNLISEDSAYTYPDIYRHKVCQICLSNIWTKKRFGTAMHETLHALGFEHEQWRKDRCKYVNVKTLDYQYEIKDKSQELTPFDPFSIMFYGEGMNMMRVGDFGFFKYK